MAAAGSIGVSCFGESRDPSPGSAQPWGPTGLRGDVLLGEEWHWKAALHQAPSAAPRGNTKLLMVST